MKQLWHIHVPILTNPLNIFDKSDLNKIQEKDWVKEWLGKAMIRLGSAKNWLSPWAVRDAAEHTSGFYDTRCKTKSIIKFCKNRRDWENERVASWGLPWIPWKKWVSKNNSRDTEAERKRRRTLGTLRSRWSLSWLRKASEWKTALRHVTVFAWWKVSQLNVPTFSLVSSTTFFSTGYKPIFFLFFFLFLDSFPVPFPS